MDDGDYVWNGVKVLQLQSKGFTFRESLKNGVVIRCGRFCWHQHHFCLAPEIVLKACCTNILDYHWRFDLKQRLTPAEREQIILSRKISVEHKDWTITAQI